MFGSRMRGPGFAFAFGPTGPGDDAGEWQPWVRGPRRGPGPFGPPPMTFAPEMLRHFARRFGMGPGGFGPGPGGPRMFGRGDMKYALLDLLQERPKHGYEMMKELEDRSGGFYSPSAGAIYPTLQLLEDRGWVTTETTEGKKVYAISDAGRAALAEHRQRSDAMGERGPWGHHHHEHGGPGREHERERGPFGRQARPELRAIRDEGVQVARLMRAAVMASGGDPERLARLRAIVTRTRRELEAYLGQGGEPRPDDAAGDEAGATGPVERV
ncbi:MAG: PadR family transcriptional regulator [Ktedonobacterales bacterium]